MDSMDDAQKGQVNTAAAEVYNSFFVPALFGQWAPVICDAAKIAAGDHVLDVACGTGVAAREAKKRDADVTGLDPNPGMLAVAKSHGADIAWIDGVAEDLPFDDGCFNAVVCQYGLMFFEDRAKAIREMDRVLKPRGRLALAVWASAETSPGYAAMIGLLEDLFDRKTADALRAPFVLGNTGDIRAILEEAGISDAKIATHTGTARFSSIAAWVETDVKGWTLADLIDDQQYQALQDAAQTRLSDFTDVNGAVAFDAPAHIITATKP